jgi:hypothetical protein
VLIVVVSFALLACIAFGWLPILRIETDFLSFWSGARLLGTGHLYSPEHMYAIQRQVGPAGELRAYTRPPFFAALVWPLGKLPYRPALIIWQVLNLAALAGVIWLWPRSVIAVLMFCWFLPTWIDLGAAQDITIFLFFAAASLALLRSGRPFAAGLVLAMCGIKFHLLLLVPLWIVARRLWAYGIGAITGALALTAVSFAAAGRDWPWRYSDLLRVHDRMARSPEKMPNLSGLFEGAPLAAIWVGLFSIAVIAAAWYAMRRMPLDQAFAIALCGGLLITPHAYLYDCVLLVPVLLILADRLGTDKAIPMTMGLNVAMLSVPVWPWLKIGQLAVLGLFGLAVWQGSKQKRTAPRMEALSAKTS